MKLSLLFIPTFFLILISCQGQNTTQFSKKQLGENVVEISSNILVILQAKDGKFWLGGNEGLYSFDGKSLIHFTKSDGLLDNQIRSIQEDKLGNIFISSLGGINKFDGKKFTILTAIKSENITANWKLDNDDLWFNILGKNGEKGPYRYDGKNLYSLEFPKHYMEDAYNLTNKNKSWSPYEVYSIYRDSQGFMWFGTANFGVCRYDGNSFKWLFEDHLTNTPEGGSFGIRSILEDKSGKFWFCNSRYRYEIFKEQENGIDTNRISYKKIIGIDSEKWTDGTEKIYFLSILEDKKGDLWMVTYDQGIWKYDGKNLSQYEVKSNSKNTTLFSIYMDQQENIYVGTHENGVYKFNGSKFVKFTPKVK